MRARDFREQIIKGTSAFSSFSLLNRHVVRALSSHHRLLWGFSHGPRPPSLLCLLVLSLCHIRWWLLTFLSPTYIPTSVSQLYLQRPWPRLSLAFSQLVFRESTELLMCYIPNASSLGMTSSLFLPFSNIFPSPTLHCDLKELPSPLIPALNLSDPSWPYSISLQQAQISPLMEDSYKNEGDKVALVRVPQRNSTNGMCVCICVCVKTFMIRNWLMWLKPEKSQDLQSASWRPGRTDGVSSSPRAGKGQRLSSSSQAAGFPLSCSIQIFKGLDEPHPHEGGPSTLLSLQMQMLISSRTSSQTHPEWCLTKCLSTLWPSQIDT